MLPKSGKGLINALRRCARQPERPLLIGDQYTRGVQEKADALAETFKMSKKSRYTILVRNPRTAFEK